MSSNFRKSLTQKKETCTVKLFVHNSMKAAAKESACTKQGVVGQGWLVALQGGSGSGSFYRDLKGERDFTCTCVKTISLHRDMFIYLTCSSSSRRPSFACTKMGGTTQRVRTRIGISGRPSWHISLLSASLLALVCYPCTFFASLISPPALSTPFLSCLRLDTVIAKTARLL